MKLLFISNLYPSSVEPGRGLFNQRLMEAMAAILGSNQLPVISDQLKNEMKEREDINVRSTQNSNFTYAPITDHRLLTTDQKASSLLVMAPFYWFPGQSLLRDRKAPPQEEVIGGIKVLHPKVFYTPGFFIHKHWLMYQRSIRTMFEEFVSEYKPDHVMIGFAYPDGAAVAPLCRELGLSYSIRINGSDFNLRIRQKKFREIVLKTLNEASLIFCPGEALKAAMIKEGIDGNKIHAFVNGVDRELFKYRSKETAREEIIHHKGKTRGNKEVYLRKDAKEEQYLPPEADKSITAVLSVGSVRNKLILFVGNLVEVKAPDVMLKSFHSLVSGARCKVTGGEDRQDLFHHEGRTSRSEGKISNSVSPAVSVSWDTPSLQTLDFTSGPLGAGAPGGEQSSLGALGSLVRESSFLGCSPSTVYRLLIVGAGPMRKDLERMAADLGLADKIIFLGQVPPQQLALLMNLADCLCLTSRSEGMPNVILEALASGLPVVATDVGGVRQTVGDSLIAKLVEVENSNRRCTPMNTDYGSVARAKTPSPRSSEPVNLSTCQLVNNYAAAIEDVLRIAHDREKAAKEAKISSWKDTAKMVLEIIRKQE